MEPVGWVLSRPYTLSAVPFSVRTADGVVLVGHRVGSGPSALIFCHGFMGWHRKRSLVPFQEELVRVGGFTVYAFDFRGHGRSGGDSALGSAEHLDVEAVVARARSDGFDRVITFGGSMGGIAAIRHAALIGGIDGVVAVSTPSRWSGHRTDAVRRLTWLTSTGSGRFTLRCLGLRVTTSWTGCEDPADTVGGVAPTPLVIVHGRDDDFFPPAQALELYEAAGDPKRLWLASRFGHAEDGYSPGFARKLSEALHPSAAA